MPKDVRVRAHYRSRPRKSDMGYSVLLLGMVSLMMDIALVAHRIF